MPSAPCLLLHVRPVPEDRKMGITMPAAAPTLSSLFSQSCAFSASPPLLRLVVTRISYCSLTAECRYVMNGRWFRGGVSPLSRSGRSCTNCCTNSEYSLCS